MKKRTKIYMVTLNCAYYGQIVEQIDNMALFRGNKKGEVYMYHYPALYFLGYL